MHTSHDTEGPAPRPMHAPDDIRGPHDTPERAVTLLAAAHRTIGRMLSDDSPEYLVRNRQIAGE